MLKFIVILLASFMALTLLCGFFPAISTSQLALGEHQIRWYWICMTGLVFAFYKVTGK